jgi:pentatricopeptide repeat protein
METHAEITKRGLDDDLLICNTLLDMYAKFGLLKEVSKTFHSLPAWDAVSWNCLLEAYTEQGHAEEALGHFAVMQQSSIALDQVAFVSYLKACGSTRTVIKGQEVHGEIVSRGFETEPIISANLIDMYAKCGWLITARKVLDLLQDQDTASWNALLSAYAEAKQFEEVINCAEHIQDEGILLNAATFACVLKSCMCIGATVYGQKMYMDIVRRGLEHLPTVGSILILMYSRTGYFGEKLQMFEELGAVDVCSWNIMISGHVQVGQSECVFRIVDTMIDKGITPNLATFACVLNACSHSGVVNRGLMYFKAMINFYGYIPAIEHYNCLIDLFGRADCITMAMALIDGMPLHPDIVVWHTLLGACLNWNMVYFGKLAFEHAVRINENSVATYLFMWNMYASFSQIDLETERQVG